MRRGRNEDKREVFLWGFVLRFRGRSNDSIQSLGEAAHLPRSYSGISKRLRINLNDWIFRRLRGNRLRLTSEGIRPLGR